MILCVFVTTYIAAFPAVSSYADGEEGLLPPPEIKAESAVLIDAASGRILFNKDMDKQEFPASTTKIMTALLAVENLTLDQVVTVDAESPFESGSRIYLQEGEQIDVNNLLHGALIPSANDCAYALGIAISGTMDQYTQLMNARAAELGATGTHFDNPNGMPNPDHVTTAHDLALIAREAMTHEEIRNIVKTYEYTIPPTNLQPEARIVHNSNRFLYDGRHYVDVYGQSVPIYHEDITGVKTGYTDAARNCLIASCKRGDIELIAVTMKGEGYDVYADSLSLFEYGFSNYETKTIVTKGEKYSRLPIIDGKNTSVDLVAAEDVTTLMKKDSTPADLAYDDQVGNAVKAPVDAGGKYAVLVVRSGDEVLGTVDLLAKSSVEAKIIKGNIKSALNVAATILKIVVAVVVFAIVMFGILILRDNARQKKRREHRKRRRANRDAHEISFIKRIK
jgi:D-alanyl-D-alanine carboxypeptidase (penicillin-binding protein 5/6)